MSQMNRRRFAAQVLKSTAALAAAVSAPRFCKQAEGAQNAAADPRFLINIHTRGG